MAELLEVLDTLDSIEREDDRQAERSWRAAQASADAGVRRWSGLVGGIASATLEAAGFHRHDRGRWRRRRMREQLPAVPWEDELGQLLARSVAGDEVATHALEAQLRADPRGFAGLAFRGGPDVCFGAEVLDVAMERLQVDAGRRAEIEHAMARMRMELEGPRPTMLERLLAARILLTWLRLNTLEVAAACDQAEGRREWYERRIERAQRLYLAAVRALADVRRLPPVHAVQVNIGTEPGQPRAFTDHS